MSRILKKIAVPPFVSVTALKQNVTVRGKNGKLFLCVDSCLRVRALENAIVFLIRKQHVRTKSILGTTRALLQNMIVGVTRGFTKKLRIVGVGYRCRTQHNVLNMSLGFSHSVCYTIPKSVSVSCEDSNEIRVTGMDKQLVGQTAAEIRSFRRAEPYKGKGIRYYNEIVRIKEIKKK